MKICSKCLQLKALDNFHKNKGMPDGLHPYCKTCKAKAASDSYWKNREKTRKTQRGHKIQSRYGIDEETYDQMHDDTGSCSICGFKGKLHLDHNHKTGKLREFICSNCNLALGLLKEDPERMERMIAYVRKHEREGSK